MTKILVQNNKLFLENLKNTREKRDKAIHL